MRWSRGNRSSWAHPWEDLEPIEWFASLAPGVLRQVARHADRVDVAAGTRLQQQGVHARWIWVVAAGALELRRDGVPLGLVLPGGAACETDVLLGAPSAVEVVAATPATVVSVPARAFHGLLDTSSLGAAVARRLAASYDGLLTGSSGASVTETATASASP